MPGKKLAYLDSATGKVASSLLPPPYHAGFYSNSGPGQGADATVPLTEGYHLTVASAPLTVTAGEGNGIAAPYLNTSPYTISPSVTLQMEFTVSNGVGDERVVLYKATVDATELGAGVDLTGWTVREQIGTDLTVTATGVDSTAGGNFIGSLFIKVLTI